MRTSGKGGSETLLFIAPGAIFLVLMFWLSGGEMHDLVVSLDRTIVRAADAALEWMSALFS